MRNLLMKRILVPTLLILLVSSARPQSVQWTRTFSKTVVSSGVGGVVAYDAAALNSNSIYVVGFFHRTVDFGNGYTLTANNFNGATHSDGFLMKMNKNGVVEWAKKIATQDWSGYGLHVDAFNNNLYVLSYDYDGTTSEAIIEKYDSNGTLIWQKTAGSNVTSLYVDHSENIYMLYQSVSTYMVRKYTPPGATSFTRTVSNTFEVEDLVADNVGNMYAVGRGISFNPIGVYIKKITSAGTELWSDAYTTSYNALGYKIDIDDSANIYIQGRFSRNYTLGGYALSTGTSDPGIYKGFIAKLDSSKNFKWVKLINDTLNVHTTNFNGAQTMDVHVADDGQRVFAAYGDTLYTYSIATGYLENRISLGSARYFGFDESPDGSIYLGGLNSLTAYVTKVSCAAPAASISASASTICNGANVTLTANGGATYLWSNFLGTDTTVTVSPTTSTTYSVTVSNAAGCSATATKTVTVNQPNGETLNNTICFGTSFPFNGQNLTTAGTYYDTLTNADGCDSVIKLNLSVNSFAASSFNESICAGESYSFNNQNLTTSGAYKDTLLASSGCDSIVTLNLTVNNNTTSSLSQSICSGSSYFFNGQNLTASGSYKDTVSNANGCDSIITLNLTVANAIAASFSESICDGESYSFNNQNLTTSGAYKDTLTASGGCDSIITLDLTVNDLPQPTITQSNDTLSTGNFSGYQWLLNGSAISNAISQQLHVTQNGDYRVIVTDANGCTDTSVVKNVTGVGGLGIIDNNKVKLYPNPNTGNFVLEFTNEAARTILITDIVGQIVFATTQTEKQMQCNLHEQPQGVYFLLIRQSGQAITLKFVLLK